MSLKIGKDLIIDVDGEDSLVTFRALNDAKSAFVSIEFEDDFFDEAIINPSNAYSCRIPAKPISAIFNPSKNLEFILLSTEQSNAAVYLTLEQALFHRVTRKFRFTFQDCEILNVKFDDEQAHMLQCVPKTFAKLLSHLHNAPEVLLTASETSFSVSSFHNERISSEKQHLNSGVSINIREFDRYEFSSSILDGASTSLVFCAKELKAVLGFCESIDLASFTMFFTTGGMPIKLRCDCPSFSVSLVLATLEIPSVSRQSQSLSQGRSKAMEAMTISKEPVAADNDINSSAIDPSTYDNAAVTSMAEDDDKLPYSYPQSSSKLKRKLLESDDEED